VKVQFKDLPYRAYFFDRDRSGEWLVKESDDCARCADGLLVQVGPAEVFDVVEMNEKKVSIREAMQLAEEEVRQCRIEAAAEFSEGLFDKAVEHHAKRGLRADLVLGVTRDREGVQSRFLDYTWASAYTRNPGHIWYDFFCGPVMNSVSRMARGLEP
jgi:ferredoxin-like protein FixX